MNFFSAKSTLKTQNFIKKKLLYFNLSTLTVDGRHRHHCTFLGQRQPDCTFPARRRPTVDVSTSVDVHFTALFITPGLGQ